MTLSESFCLFFFFSFLLLRWIITLSRERFPRETLALLRSSPGCTLYPELVTLCQGAVSARPGEMGSCCLLLPLQGRCSPAVLFLLVVAETETLLSVSGEVGRAAPVGYFPGELKNRSAFGFECFPGSLQED